MLGIIRKRLIILNSLILYRMISSIWCSFNTVDIQATIMWKQS